MSRIINISDAALIAFHALAMIAESDGYISNNKIATSMGISKNHLSKVLQILHKNGLIKSAHGPTGGYCLAMFPEEISFKQVLELIDGPFPNSPCLLASSICYRKRCIFGGLISSVNIYIADTLRNIKLSDFRTKEGYYGK